MTDRRTDRQTDRIALAITAYFVLEMTSTKRTVLEDSFPAGKA